jgi:hypothetical protein
MFLTCIFEIPNPLSLNVKLYLCKNIFFWFINYIDYQLWFIFFIETNKVRITTNL